MKISRRLALQLLAGTGLGMGLDPAAMTAEPQNALDPSAHRTLTSLVDTLIPDDGATPGAVQTGVEKRLVAMTQSIRQYRVLIVNGCLWLDDEARKLGAPSFTDLGEEQRNAIIERASRAEQQSVPRRLFEATRNLVFFAYYGSASGWQAIGYGGPPQPVGFPDYAQAPAGTRQRDSEAGSHSGSNGK